jgi:hypothetical protein
MVTKIRVNLSQTTLLLIGAGYLSQSQRKRDPTREGPDRKGWVNDLNRSFKILTLLAIHNLIGDAHDRNRTSVLLRSKEGAHTVRIINYSTINQNEIHRRFGDSLSKGHTLGGLDNRIPQSIEKCWKRVVLSPHEEYRVHARSLSLWKASGL